MPRRPKSARERARGKALAARLREWRESADGGRGMTQQGLANRSGVQLDTIRSIEADKVVDPGFSVVAQIVVRGLGRSLDDLAEVVLP